MATRLERIAEHIEDTSIESNGFEMPTEAGRYLVIEKWGGEWVWAMNCADLDEAATEISASDTDRDNVVIYDLDDEEEDNELVPILEVTRILGNGVDFYPKKGGQ